MLTIGLKTQSRNTTLGAGDPFVPTNLDFIDWEDRGAEFVAVNGRSAEKIRQDYHDLFETGLLDPFKNGIFLAFAGVTFDTCFTPGVARNFDEPVDNAGFVAGDHFPDGLQGRDEPYIDTELGFLSSNLNDNSVLSWIVALNSGTNGADFGNVAGVDSDTCHLISRFTAGNVFLRNNTSGVSTGVREKGIRLMVRSESSQYRYFYDGGDATVGANSESVSLANMTFFARGGSNPTNSRMACVAFGDAHPDPVALRTALNDLFITKMGITI